MRREKKDGNFQSDNLFYLFLALFCFIGSFILMVILFKL